ncbi:glycine cleavage system aminomethyltransferase GcvT [Microbacterium sp. G2-8]|uniref:glycine cleavage system aminomethyltransferase GcvT n=1 Tax=Microbacterium sp. G2-8 TaxID=2842454 RepID=UPI001C8980BF|nr:glycine cleavage system aminomethyltransferase GcvT [Microbacterium sp. G2-8]
MSSPPSVPLRETPLAAAHESAGAVFTDFGGWRMPVRYGSHLDEHHAVRRAAGLFDISHMGEILVTGTDAGDFLDYALAGRLSAVDVGRAKYSMLLAGDGGIVDDLVSYRLGSDEFLVVPNAANREVVARALAERARGFDVAVRDVSDDYALVALQGPASRRILEATGDVTGVGVPLDVLRNYAWSDATFAGSLLLIGRTGYTGEDGFELYVPVAHAPALWQALLDAGAPHGLVPAGLAARDTLRLEAGMPLYGHELSRDIAPVQAGLGRIIPATKTDFVGEAAKEPRPGARVLVGLATEGRRAGREGYAVLRGDAVVGEITSGALSPTLGHPIAMAYLDPDAADADDLTIDVRGTRIAATVTDLPFYRSQT